MRHCLSIAGSDCSGGAGVQADLKTFSALGTFGMSVIVSVVAENTSRVISVWDVPPQGIRDQMDAIWEDIRVDAVKIGMLSGQGTMETVAEKLRQYRPEKVVVDPVMVAKGGCALMDPDALDTLRREIIPLSALITPNLPETQALTGILPDTRRAREAAARALWEMGAKNVLIKGGHMEGEAEDLLFDGENFLAFTGKRVETPHTHGTGCTLSSAITAYLALGKELPEAVGLAKEYVTQAIRYGFPLGKGHGPTQHFFDYYLQKGWISQDEEL